MKHGHRSSLGTGASVTPTRRRLLVTAGHGVTTNAGCPALLFLDKTQGNDGPFPGPSLGVPAIVAAWSGVVATGKAPGRSGGLTSDNDNSPVPIRRAATLLERSFSRSMDDGPEPLRSVQKCRHPVDIGTIQFGTFMSHVVGPCAHRAEFEELGRGRHQKLPIPGLDQVGQAVLLAVVVSHLPFVEPVSRDKAASSMPKNSTS